MGLLSAWLIGIILTAVIIPMAEQAISRVLQIFPSELDLIRGLRFIVPLSLIATFLALATWRASASGLWHRWPFFVFALILLISTQKTLLRLFSVPLNKPVFGKPAPGNEICRRLWNFSAANQLPTDRFCDCSPVTKPWLFAIIA